MKLQVRKGWEPGIVSGGKLHPPGATFECPDDEAAQFIANGSAEPVRRTVRRGGKKAQTAERRPREKR